MIRRVRAVRILQGLFVLLLIVAALAPLGCGGGGVGSPTPTPTPPTSGSLSLHVPWPDRTRNIPLGANSLAISLTFGSGGSPVFSRLLVRTAQDTAYVDDITIPNLSFGSYQANVTAFADAAGTGTVLGSATVPFVLSVSNANPTVALDTSITSAVAQVRPAGGTVGNPLYTAFPLSAVLLSSTGNVLTAVAHQITWSSSDPANVAVDANGNVTANLVEQATITATDRDSGRNASLTLQLGCPLTLTAGIAGTTSELPLYSNEPDDTQSIAKTATTGTPAGFVWVGDKAANRYTLVTLKGNPVTLTAPDTYGNIAFTGWTLNGTPFASTAAVTIDPKLHNTLGLTANYATRAATADGFTPNYLGEQDIAFDPARPNQLVRWALGTVRVTFVTADNFTTARKAQCVDGFNWWPRTTGGKIGFTLLNDNDTANADVIVCLTSDPFSASCRPDLFQAGLTPVARGTTSGRTFFKTDPTEDANAPITDGIGKRVIQIYVTDATALPPVAAHEFVHAIGMNGHSENASDVMYPVVGTQPFPSGRDVNTVETILLHSRAAQTPGRSKNAGTARAVAVP